VAVSEKVVESFFFPEPPVAAGFHVPDAFQVRFVERASAVKVVVWVDFASVDCWEVTDGFAYGGIVGFGWTRWFWQVDLPVLGGDDDPSLSVLCDAIFGTVDVAVGIVVESIAVGFEGVDELVVDTVVSNLEDVFSDEDVRFDFADDFADGVEESPLFVVACRFVFGVT